MIPLNSRQSTLMTKWRGVCPSKQSATVKLYTCDKRVIVVLILHFGRHMPEITAFIEVGEDVAALTSHSMRNKRCRVRVEESYYCQREQPFRDIHLSGNPRRVTFFSGAHISCIVLQKICCAEVASNIELVHRIILIRLKIHRRVSKSLVRSPSRHMSITM